MPPTVDVLRPNLWTSWEVPTTIFLKSKNYYEIYCSCKKSAYGYSVKNNREDPAVLPLGLDYAVCTPPCWGLPSSRWDPPPLERGAPLACFVSLWHGHTHTHALLCPWALPDFELDVSVCPCDSRGRPGLCPAPPSGQPGRPPWPRAPHCSPGPLSLRSSGEGDVAACGFPAAQF